MALGLHAFGEAIPDLTDLSHNERVLVFIWYLTEFAGQSRAKPTEIARCYRDLSLHEPQRLHQHIAQGERTSPKGILRDRDGLRLEKRTRDRLWNKYREA